MDKIVSEHISGQLLREGKSIYVRLKIEVKEYTPDESHILRYTFEGKQTEKSYRVQGGKLYAG